jgi:Geminivirus Rep catalytic domain
MSFSQFRSSSVSVADTASVVSDGTSLTGASTLSSGSVPRSPKEAALHRKWLFLTYAQCSLKDKEVFEQQFVEMLRHNGLFKATYYGCRELHSDEGIHYHVLLNLGDQVNWTFTSARERFAVEGNECDSLHISTPRAKQSYTKFIENHVNYVEKEAGGDCFGTRPCVGQEKVLERKRKWDEIGTQQDAVSKFAKMKEHFPDAYYKCFNSIKSAIAFEHENDGSHDAFELPSYVDPTRFRVPPAILKWEFENLICPAGGRRKSLLIVGETRTGKSSLAVWIASRYGEFSEFDTEWDPDQYKKGQVCAVFHDMKRDFRYWKGVFGCQPFITVHGRYRPTCKLTWDVPSIWVCNYEDDPRNWDDERLSYIEKNAVIYEVPKGSSLYGEDTELWGAPGSAWGGEARSLEIADEAVVDGCLM